MNAKEFRKMYLGLQYNQVNTLTPFAIDEMLEVYLKSKVEAISDEEIHEAGFQFYETIEDKRIWERGTIWFKNQILKQ